jgi:hypothetical protein
MSGEKENEEIKKRRVEGWNDLDLSKEFLKQYGEELKKENER